MPELTIVAPAKIIDAADVDNAGGMESPSSNDIHILSVQAWGS